MPKQLNDIVRFRGDRLFNGAVDISWYTSDELKSKTASESFVFHGPKYHGVQQEDIGNLHGHKLIDTANLTRSVLRRCYGFEDQPFTLAIAGYGTGKSHLGLTLANLVSNPTGESAKKIISAIEVADSKIGSDVRLLLQEASQPCIAVALNGIQGFDLVAELTKQITMILKKDGHDSKPLNDLRPRFGQAVTLVNMSNKVVQDELLTSTESDSIDSIIQKLKQQDERTYAKVHDFFAARGMPIRALSGESVRDVIDITVKEYCGVGKPYKSLLILFDEFGKYTEFATVRSHIAGSGILQELFEAIQANANNVCFVGFIQFELNVYVQRVAPEFKNEILRYITRYQSANKFYLSINLETLISSLLEKRQENLLDDHFNCSQAYSETQSIMTNLSRWFPNSRNHRIWSDEDLFHTVIRKGCWPLSPYSTWLLYYLAAAGKHLQERSALILLGDVFQRFAEHEVKNVAEWILSPADLWSDVLQQELISSEETGQQGSITLAYASVYAKHSSQLSIKHIKLLRAIVLASKLGLFVTDKDEVIEAITELSGLDRFETDKGIKLLQEEYNVIEWDEAFKAFDILGDAVPRTQFLSFIRQRVASSYDEFGISTIFASRATEWCDLLMDLECDFAEENKISTHEWRYQAITSNLDYLPQQIKIASDRWSTATDVDEARGTIIYVYVGQSHSVDDVVQDTVRILRTTAREVGFSALPVLVVLLNDNNGNLGQSLAEFAVLEDISETDKAKFGNLIGAHKEKLSKAIREHVDSLIKERNYVTALTDDLGVQRLSQVGTGIFKRIYKKPIFFPFDGFRTSSGNAAYTCHDLTCELLHGKLDYNSVIAKSVKEKNRAVKVLKETWGIFNKNGEISRRPTYPVIRAITEKWDDTLSKEQKLSMKEAIKQICYPPFGANIASAGLILGVFVSPRYEKIAVLKDGQQLDISQWIQDGIFKGKFINLSLLHDVDIVNIGEASSEWETLLDEWEHCANHLANMSCLQRANNLKERLSLPPLLVYREEGLRNLANEAIQELNKHENVLDSASKKIEKGLKHADVSQLSWGVSLIKNQWDKMESENNLWTESQIEEVKSFYERERQAVIQVFPNWLKGQAPNSASPDEVGAFKHKMLHLVGNNLKELNLENEYLELEQYTQNAVRYAETLTEARQLSRDVNSWLDQHQDVCRIIRVSEIRGLKDVGNGFKAQLKNIYKRIEIKEIIEARTRLSDFLNKLKDTEKEMVDRASKLWDSHLHSFEELNILLEEVEDLIKVFEGCEMDIDDLRIQKKVLHAYQEYFSRLKNEQLSWKEFDSLANNIKKEANEVFGKEEGFPWLVEETIDNFVQSITDKRRQNSATWIETIKSESNNITEMSANDANRLHTKANNPPAFITDQDKEHLEKIIDQIEKHLESLTLEWLIEKFKELQEPSKKKFLSIITKMIDDNQ